MPPKAKKKKEQSSKKADQKKKEKILEDKTFGLKNKNKSKVVQARIKSVEKNVMNSGDPKMRKMEEQRRQAKAAAKARKKAETNERDALFGEALMAMSKKSTNKKGGKVEAKGRDADEEKKGGTSRAMKMMFQMDAKEMEEKLREDPNYVPTLEDEIEHKRQKMIADLKKSGKKGTPVTEQSLKQWLERKRKRRMEEARKKVEAEMRKKKGGKGLAVLSGRELYDYNKELFAKGEEEDDLAEAEKAKDVAGENGGDDGEMTAVAEKVQSNLFLEGDDDDLDDIEDDDLDDIEDDDPDDIAD
eukprot:CAMPEP_0172496872 /NCGR_PEP_ID=MMETSP1066-20121228/94377_1 /TAXON_ID=671091 /ORGANISM="Coscinodiscus wailesii, Strain CCMP2513" /LENGTH=300 /DNA_ID=CAMNT_0013269399 /DNA_START=48 /DNA_END=950 /DNA_ORIENTATION=+